MSDVLIVRPEPGASATAARVRALGLEPAVAPIFTVRPIAWDASAEGFEAVMLTSAQAARLGGEGLDRFTHLPCYAVGSATAAAARANGFDEVRTGPSGAAALVAMMTRDGVRRVLHFAGRDHLAVAGDPVAIERRIVYAAEAHRTLPLAATVALGRGARVLLHSPRAARTFAALVDAAGLDRAAIALAAISPAAAEAAGTGWRSADGARRPREEALLELAAKLCQTDAAGQKGNDDGD